MSKKGSIETISELQANLIGLCKGTETNLFTLSQSLSSAYKIICDSMESQEFPGVPSHLQGLNKLIGGFRKGNLIVIGARPGVGKTAIATNFIHHLIRKGLKVLFVSAEMTKEEIATRLLSIESSVPADLLINKPNHLKTTELEAINRVISSLAQKHCFLLDEPNVRSDRLFLAAGSAEQQMGGLDFVVVDYLQILEGRTKQHIRSKADYLAEIVKDLKALAKRHNVPVLALAQLNRDSEHGKPSLRSFADTSQLEKESDVAMILWREKRDFGGWDHQLRIEKNRNGQTGFIRLYFDEQRMYFSEEQRSPVNA
jgi:replicative DNA helicase